MRPTRGVARGPRAPAAGLCRQVCFLSTRGPLSLDLEDNSWGLGGAGGFAEGACLSLKTSEVTRGVSVLLCEPLALA